MTSGTDDGRDDVFSAGGNSGLGGFYVEDAADSGEHFIAEGAADIGDDLQRIGRCHGDFDAGDAAFDERPTRVDELLGAVGTDDGDDAGRQQAGDDFVLGHGLNADF